MEHQLATVQVAHFSDELAARTSELLDEPGELSVSELERLVERIAARPDLWRPLVVVDRDRRRYELLYEDERGRTCLEYDKPASLFGQFQNDRISPTAAMLDKKLEALIAAAVE